MKVQLEPGVWLTDDEEGDPPRTLDPINAMDFKTTAEAWAALTEARKYRPFPNAIIEDSFL